MYLSKETLINIDNSQKSTESSTKHYDSKTKLAYYEMFCEMCLFSTQIYLKVNFYIARGGCI